MGDSIDPGPKAAALVERSQAPPNGDVDLLKEITATVNISFVRTRQAGQSSTAGINRNLVQLVVVSHRAVDVGPFMR